MNTLLEMNSTMNQPRTRETRRAKSHICKCILYTMRVCNVYIRSVNPYKSLHMQSNFFRWLDTSVSPVFCALAMMVWWLLLLFSSLFAPSSSSVLLLECCVSHPKGLRIQCVRRLTTCFTFSCIVFDTQRMCVWYSFKGFKNIHSYKHTESHHFWTIRFSFYSYFTFIHGEPKRNKTKNCASTCIQFDWPIVTIENYRRFYGLWNSTLIHSNWLHKIQKKFC